MENNNLYNITNSFIYYKWYEEDEFGYNLANDYSNMLMHGYGRLFNYTHENYFIRPYQGLPFYCINKDGYLKIYRFITNYIPSWSINDMLKDIESICITHELKFISISSPKYNFLWLERFLGTDLKYEYNNKGETKLYI